MKKILHIATECYPAAKAGGLGDVVGALPAYLPAHDIEAHVVIPKYKNKWFVGQNFKTLHESSFDLGYEKVSYSIQQLIDGDLGFPFFCIDIPGKFDRASVYLDDDGFGYKDEAQRNISFQIAVLRWLTETQTQYDGLHCHDHMTALIPFMVKYCPDFQAYENTPTFFTIHNGAYRGIYGWDMKVLLPGFDDKYSGLLDWDGDINSLATAIKCAWAVNTVSPSYMKEIVRDSDTLNPLYEHEKAKCSGILNGVDVVLWDPAKDKFLDVHLEEKKWSTFKSYHKNRFLKKYGLKSRVPLIGFIGRLATQKGADLLMDAIEQSINENLKFSAVILGSGDKGIEQGLVTLSKKYPDRIAAIIAYDEALARSIYAASDFLIMPSRFEPCGLNQLFAMRYGSVPIVSAVGGLLDTVPDIEEEGNGIVISALNADQITIAIERASKLYSDKKQFNNLRKKIVELDYSWHKSAGIYTHLYHSFIK